MIVALGDVYALVPARDRVRRLMESTQARVREQPGCVSYVFAETLDDPGHFLVVQRWRDRAAFDEHYASRVFADYQAAITDSLERASELRVHDVQASYEPLDSAPMDPRRAD